MIEQCRWMEHKTLLSGESGYIDCNFWEDIPVIILDLVIILVVASGHLLLMCLSCVRW